VIENNMPDRTEHGYAATNNYAIETGLNMDALLEAEQIANKLFNQYQ
jgi:hypothetical protein